MPEKREHKRKRGSDHLERPRKKAATSDQNASKIKITHVPAEKLSRPVIATASGVHIPSDYQFDAYTKREGRMDDKEMVLYSSSHPRINYTAREHLSGGISSHLKHYVGVYDPETRILKVIEACKMNIRTTLRREDEEMCNHRKTLQPKEPSKRQDLGMTFGTKKAKKAIESISQNAISPRVPRNASPGSVRKAIKHDPTAATVLESMAESAKNAPSLQEIQDAAEESKPRPPHNIHGETPDEVYDVLNIIGSEVMDDIKVKKWMEDIEESMAKKNKKKQDNPAKLQPNQTHSSFAARRALAIVEKYDIKKAKSLKYFILLFEYFIRLKPAGSGIKRLPKGDKLKEDLGIDKSIVGVVTERFSQNGEVNKWYSNKITLHLLVIALIIDDFASDTYDIQGDLRLSTQNVSKLYAELGVKCDAMTEKERLKADLNQGQASQHRIARLKLPLQFPKPRSSVRRR